MFFNTTNINGLNYYNTKQMEINNQYFYVKQLPTGCLSQYAYYIESNKEAVVIDPIRDIQQYIDLVKSRNATLKYVIDTHIHADFVSGYCDLAKKTGAQVVIGPKDEITFSHIRGDDGKILNLGEIDLKLIHTPGHTLESICILLINKKEGNKQEAVFTGDTLFVGDVGRPDLAVKSGKITKRDLTDHLFDSLKKLVVLDDNCKVMPGHGAGSACGKNLGSESYSTIGEQKTANYALKIKDKDEFYNALVEGLPLPPDYFFHDVSMNLNNDKIKTADEILALGKTGLVPEKVEELIKNPDYVIIDTRDSPDFVDGHVPSSINVPLKFNTAIWAASIIEVSKRIIVVCYAEKVEESILRLARTGMDNIDGYLKDGIEAWTNAGKSLATLKKVKPAEIPEHLNGSGKCTIVDVRNDNEIEAGTLQDAHFLHLDNVNKKAEENFDKNTTLFVMCRSGARAIVASSILQRQGYDVRVIEGGFVAAKEHGLKIKYPKLVK